MSASFGKIKSHFANWREWEINPIVIKELRQAVRSWAVTGMLLVFLTVLFITSLVFLVAESSDVDANLGLGGDMFSTFAVILAVASILFIPLYVGIRVAAERQENNPDLLYVSTLSPARIIRGKFLCGVYVVVLFFSACMPFMAFTNLLRGVDLPTVFSILFHLFLTVCAANMVAIFFACLPMSRPFKILLALVGFFASFWLLVPLLIFSFRVMGLGVGTMMSRRDFWIQNLTEIGVGALITGLFYVLSVALISPPSMNRARSLRTYLTVMWLIGGLLSLLWVWQTSRPELILSWTTPTFVLMILSLLVIVSNSDQLSLRVRREIPVSRFKRALAFLFFNGAAGGLIWAAVIIVSTLLMTAKVLLAKNPWFSKPTPVSASDHGLLVSWTAVLAYVFAYLLTALLIQRKFLPKRSPKLAGLLAVLLASLWAILPGVILFSLDQLTWTSFEGLQLGNVFNVFSSLRTPGEVNRHLLFSGIWLALALVLNAKWFFRQVKYFQPLARTAQPAVAAGAPPALP
jgi:hypothetical protein